MKFLSMCASFLALSTWASAEIKLGSYFSDHTVLQQGKPVPVWGWANPGEKVEVSFAGQTANTKADAQGRWQVTLPALNASAEGRPLVIKAGKDARELRDVVVGEVWLLGGQSNMEWGMGSAERAAEETPLARYPLVRHLKIEKAKADAPQTTAPNSGWVPCSPDTVGAFSAVGYYFAKDIHTRLGVPVGLVNATWGGTNAETWIPADVIASTPALAHLPKRWDDGASFREGKEKEFQIVLAAWEKAAAEAKAAGKAFNQPKPEAWWELLYPQQPSACYNGMIHPLLPASVRGVLWYQGESNAGRADEYSDVFKKLIQAWRTRLGDEVLPFYFVQLANYKDNDPLATNWARLREAQASALVLPATGQAITIDIGDVNDIHPRNKHEVGRRLALIARAQLYGQSIDYSGPVLISAVREGAAYRLQFKHTAGALTAREKPLAGFEIAGADRVFHPATATIQKDTLLVTSPVVKEPVAVRYAFRNAPDANLYNGAGLPASPFRTDDWP